MEHGLQQKLLSGLHKLNKVQLLQTRPLDVTITTNSSGIWYFTGKNKSTEDKKAENLILATTRSQVKTEDRPTTSGGFFLTFDVTYNMGKQRKYTSLAFRSFS
jgi:hypothetical protein